MWFRYDAIGHCKNHGLHLKITGCFGSTDQLCFKHYEHLCQSGCATTIIGASGPASIAGIGGVFGMMLLVVVEITHCTPK